MRSKPTINALLQTAAGRPGSNPRVSCAGSLSLGRWVALLVRTRFSIATVILALLAVGCAGPKQAAPPQEANLAVNLRLENERDLEPIQKALVSAGIPCSANRAMSCNEAPLKVDVRDFERAKAIAQETIIRHSLTARLYESPTNSSLLVVWEKGQKTRVEPHRLYNPSANMADFLMEPAGREHLK